MSLIIDGSYDVVNKVPMKKFVGICDSNLYLVDTLPKWRAFFDLLMQQKKVFADTETSGFHWFLNDRVCGMSFGWYNMDFYIPVRHKDSLTGGPVQQQLDFEDIREDVQRFFSQEDVTTVWHNYKFDKKAYYADDIHIFTEIEDTLIAWKLFDENAPAALKTISSGWKDDMGFYHEPIVHKDANAEAKTLRDWRAEEAKERRKVFSHMVMEMADDLQHDLKYQGLNRNELKKVIKETLVFNHPYANVSIEDIGYDLIPIDIMAPYGALDTFLTRKVYDYLVENKPDIFSGNSKLRRLYLNELALTHALFDAEVAGIPANRKYIVDTRKQVEKEIEELELKIKEVLGDINLNSTKQLAEALTKRGVKFTKFGKSKTPTLDSTQLEKLSKQYEECALLLQLRKKVKLKTAFFDSILEKLTDDNIIYPVFNQNVATGRMSSNSPNMQQMPQGPLVRNIFQVPSDEYIYLLADYSQIEVRLTAHFSKDPVLLDAYKSNKDVHTATFCGMFGYNYDEVVEVLRHSDHTKYKLFKQLRGAGKVLNFGIIYGVSAMGLSEQIPRPDIYANQTEEQWVSTCEEFIRMYKRTHRGVNQFIRDYSRFVAENHYIENPFGRIRTLPHANACKLKNDRSLYWMEQRAKRQGVNAVVQGTAGDVFKTAVVRVHKLLQGKKSYMVNFVHDEIQIFLHKSEIDLINDIKHEMENFRFRVPLKVDFEYSLDSWGNKQELH